LQYNYVVEVELEPEKLQIGARGKKKNSSAERHIRPAAPSNKVTIKTESTRKKCE